MDSKQKTHNKTVNKLKIMQAAKTLFLQGGVRALSVRAIAQQAGLSTIGIYSHFNGKQGILDSIYIEGFSLVFDAMDIPLIGQSAETVILTGASNYLDLATSHRAHYQLIFGGSDPHYQPSKEAQKAGVKAFNQLVKLSAGLMPVGCSLPAQQKFALEIWAIVHGYVSLMHHPVVNLVNIKDWKNTALEAVKTHIS